jgi:hypothetical protein
VRRIDPATRIVQTIQRFIARYITPVVNSLPTVPIPEPTEYSLPTVPIPDQSA